VDQVRQRQEIGQTKWGAATSDHDHGIDGKQVRPPDWQRPQRAICGLDGHSRFAPALAGDDVPDHGAAQRVEGVRDAKLWRIATITSSRQLWRSP
jgi:hypothetical protein